MKKIAALMALVAAVVVSFSLTNANAEGANNEDISNMDNAAYDDGHVIDNEDINNGSPNSMDTAVYDEAYSSRGEMSTSY